MTTTHLIFFWFQEAGEAQETVSAPGDLVRKIRRRLPNGQWFEGTEAEYLALSEALRRQQTQEKPKERPDEKVAVPEPEMLDAILMALQDIPGPLSMPPIELPELTRFDWGRILEARRAREQQNALVALLLAA